MMHFCKTRAVNNIRSVAKIHINVESYMHLFILLEKSLGDINLFERIPYQVLDNPSVTTLPGLNKIAYCIPLER
jgi:hypothetical protein